jgi:hypothetical protein
VCLGWDGKQDEVTRVFWLVELATSLQAYVAYLDDLVGQGDIGAD